MSKRVHELAKELNRSNKEVLAALAEKNVEVKSHMSVLSEEQEAMVKKPSPRKRNRQRRRQRLPDRKRRQESRKEPTRLRRKRKKS